MKIPMTPAGIKPAIFQFVAQHLNHCVTTVPYYVMARIIIQEILVNHGQSNGMANVCSKYHTVRVKCMGPPNAAGTHLPPFKSP